MSLKFVATTTANGKKKRVLLSDLKVGPQKNGIAVRERVFPHWKCKQKKKRRKRAKKLRKWENVLASSFYQKSLANSSAKTKTASTKETQIKHNHKNETEVDYSPSRNQMENQKWLDIRVRHDNKLTSHDYWIYKRPYAIAWDHSKRRHYARV